MAQWKDDDGVGNVVSGGMMGGVFLLCWEMLLWKRGGGDFRYLLIGKRCAKPEAKKLGPGCGMDIEGGEDILFHLCHHLLFSPLDIPHTQRCLTLLDTIWYSYWTSTFFATILI